MAAGVVYGVAVSGNYAYVADGGKGLVVVDVSDKLAPSLAGSYDTAGYADADVSRDGSVTSLDALMLLQAATGL